jgi:hypothetical protein
MTAYGFLDLIYKPVILILFVQRKLPKTTTAQILSGPQTSTNAINCGKPDMKSCTHALPLFQDPR